MRKCNNLLQRMSVLSFLLLSFLYSSAQNSGTLKGTVKDASGNPLSGASVALQGQRGGTITDANGNYLLQATAGTYTLVVSYVGQGTLRFPVQVIAGGVTTQDTAMKELSDLSSVVIVGSRSRQPRSKLSTPVPVDVINAREAKQFAQADLSQMLTYVTPSFQSARQTISDGTDHIDPAGLRGLGPDQTLVLVNGKRRHTTALVNINGTVGRGSVGTDLNAIPVAAIERIEVLRDGAAAQYGSDAIAGVINVVLKKNYTGFNISGMLGENVTSMPYNGHVNINDGLNRQIDFSGGYGWKNGAYINLSGQWLKRDGSNRSGLDNIPLIYYGNAGALPPTTAIPPGVTPADYYHWLIDLDRKKVSDRKYSLRNIVAGNSSANNLGTFLNAGFPISPKAEAYFTAGISHRTGAASGFSRNPNSWSQQPVKANGDLYYADGFLPEIHTTINDYSLIAGAKTSWGVWDVDLSNTIGQNTIHYNIENTGNASLPASDNVQTEFDAGKLSFLQNTVNLDVNRKFSLGTGTSFNLALGAEYRYEQYRIRAGEPNSWQDTSTGGRQFQPQTVPPYPGSATGYTPAGGPGVPGAQVFPGFRPSDATNAHRNIYAVYADGELQGNKYILGAAVRYETYKEFEASYDNVSGKLSGRYDISKGIAVRGSVSTGFRAPSLHQRYFQNTSTQFTGGVPLQALTANNYSPVVRNAFGIKELTPEKSYSFTAGVVGTLFPGFTFTVDAYFIRINDRIVLSTQFARSNGIVDSILKANAVSSSISALQFWTNAINTETKGIDIVVTERFKLGKGTITLAAAANVNRNSVVGGLNTNSVIDDPKVNPSLGNPNANPANDLSLALFDRQQRSRIEVAQPRSKVNLTAGYDLPKWNLQVRAVRFGKVEYVHNLDANIKNPVSGAYFNDVGIGTDQTFGAKWTTDVVVTYKAMTGLQLTIGANNVFDVYPDRIFIDPRNDPSAYYTTPLTTGANKTVGGYNASRDASNRGRFLFTANQFGFNGRFLFARINLDIVPFSKGLKKK
jgi:iron complex outermembrane receptor protein